MPGDASTVAAMVLFELQPERYKSGVTAGVLLKHCSGRIPEDRCVLLDKAVQRGVTCLNIQRAVLPLGSGLLSQGCFLVCGPTSCTC